MIDLHAHKRKIACKQAHDEHFKVQAKNVLGRSPFNLHRIAGRRLAILLAACMVWCQPCTGTPAGDGPDPVCSVPNRLNIVLAARAQASERLRLDRRRALTTQAPPPAGFGLNWDREANLPHLFLRSPAGKAWQVDSTSSLDLVGWHSLFTINMTGDRLEWLDSTAGSVSSRFYRLKTLQEDPEMETVDDFLLLDHEGKAHELFYPANLKALAIVAAGDSADQLDAVLASLKPIAQAYSTNDVQVWILLSDQSAGRTNVAAQVRAADVKFPVLFDPERLGIHALQLTRAGEVVVVQPPAFTVAYRGQLEISPAAGGDHPYLGASLEGLVRDQPITFVHTPLTGPLLSTPGNETPSYSRDIAPIFREHCAICHRPGDVAPFAMTGYDVVHDWAPLIKHALLIGEMPPWHVDPAYGHWSNSLALPASAKSALLRWVDAGAPRGDGSDPLAELPLPPSFRVWPAELGPPDAVVTPGLQSINLSGFEPYRYLAVRAPNPSNVWLRAAIILPSSAAIVHHYLVWTGTNITSADPNGVSLYNDGLAIYVPGMKPYLYPSDSGFFLAKSNWLTFNLHYTPNGEATNDLPTLALWYHKTKPPKTFHNPGIGNDSFRIPPGNPEFPVQALTFTLDHTIRVHRFNPHMHLRGKRMSFEVIYPNGTREMLLSVPDYSFKWQTGYELAEPKTLTAGTRIVVKGAFDNSPENVANPDPTATVLWGDQTTSEMFVGFIDYVD
jgi:hypothetical protein